MSVFIHKWNDTRGAQEERDAHEAMMSTFRSRRGLDDDAELYALLGGNRCKRT